MSLPLSPVFEIKKKKKKNLQIKVTKLRIILFENDVGILQGSKSGIVSNVGGGRNQLR